MTSPDTLIKPTFEEVALFGSSAHTQWREPYLEQLPALGLKVFNPNDYYREYDDYHADQMNKRWGVSSITSEHYALELAKLHANKGLLRVFVITSQTPSFSSLAELSYSLDFFGDERVTIAHVSEELDAWVGPPDAKLSRQIRREVLEELGKFASSPSIHIAKTIPEAFETTMELCS